MPEPREAPYVWVTSLSKLMAGDNHCEWASWFTTHYESWSYQKMPSTFDLAAGQLKHNAMVSRVREQLEANGKSVTNEKQNQFALKGKVATVGGRPDLIATSGDTATIYEAKTGQPRVSDQVQAMVYMYAVPWPLLWVSTSCCLQPS